MQPIVLCLRKKCKNKVLFAVSLTCIIYKDDLLN